MAPWAATFFSIKHQFSKSSAEGDAFSRVSHLVDLVCYRYHSCLVNELDETEDRSGVFDSVVESSASILVCQDRLCGGGNHHSKEFHVLIIRSVHCRKNLPSLTFLRTLSGARNTEAASERLDISWDKASASRSVFRFVTKTTAKGLVERSSSVLRVSTTAICHQQKLWSIKLLPKVFEGTLEQQKLSAERSYPVTHLILDSEWPGDEYLCDENSPYPTSVARENLVHLHC